MNISKDIRSEDFKASWVCSIITENRSTGSELKRVIFFKGNMLYWIIFTPAVMEDVELREPPRLSDWETFHNTIYSDSRCLLRCIHWTQLLFFGFSLSLASALRLIFLTNELQVIKIYKLQENLVRNQANGTNDSQSFS